MSIETIGSTPAEEDCAQIGSSHYDFGDLNRLECQAYCFALQRKYGDPPAGSRLMVQAQEHDFGTYREAAYKFDPADAAHIEYAGKVETGLKTWAEVGMHPPVAYSENGRVVLILREPAQWLIAS